MSEINWSAQHCGLHRSSYSDAVTLMPDLTPVFASLPDDPGCYTFDVKVHMLMPGQFPCIPNWHFDNVPRVDGKQDFSLVRLGYPMFLWVSGPPITQFRDGRPVAPRSWVRFTQADEHRGASSAAFCWRGFIRATHKDLLPAQATPLRRHSQVYLDAVNFTW